MKQFFKKLFKTPSKQNFVEFEIKCEKCGEIVSVRVNQYDLQQDLDSDSGSYILKKEVQDTKCFKIMTLEAKFDGNRNILSKSVSGGKFIK